MTDTNSAQEAASWREMQEVLQEAYGTQELEGESSTNRSNGYGQRRTVNISTPMVVIRITMAPSRRPIFTNRRVIADAVPTPTPGITATATPYVPVQAPMEGGGAPTPARGVVFLPQKGANQVDVATNSPAYAGDWVRRQAQVLPAFGQRIRRVQVLVDGKPCKTCVRSLVRNVQPVMPVGSRVHVRYTRPATSTGSRLNPPVATLGSRPAIRYPKAPSASRTTSTDMRYRSPQRPPNATARPAIRYPKSPAAGSLASNAGQTRSAQNAAATSGRPAIRYPKTPAAGKLNPQQRPSTVPATLAKTPPANGTPRQTNGRFAPRQAPVNQSSPKPAAPRPAMASARTDKQQRESQTFLGSLFGESGL